jgi:hypothetical protein
MKELLVLVATAVAEARSRRCRAGRLHGHGDVQGQADRYSLGVYDGFPVSECACVHTFKSILIVAV